jgi:methylenetetrahydrofolate dehydrogenase (NADP+)/methenyltetrahydrofolate cyclohydrolase
MDKMNKLPASNSLYGKELANKILNEVTEDVQKHRKLGWVPKLFSLTIGATDSVDVYVRNQRRVAEKCCIDFEERHFPSDVSQQEMESVIHTLNVDPRVTGIIIQRPVPAQISVKALQSSVHPFKDVEGMNPASIGNIVYNELQLAPCTALASVELLKSTNISLEGLEVVVVGHSEIVGKPMAFLLMSEGATVTVCHHMTRAVSMHSRRADALMVAVGRPNLIGADMVKPGAVVIDIGINNIEGPDGKQKIVGDVNFDEVAEVAGWVTPVPGGVGPVTVAILMRNTITALKQQRDSYEKEFMKKNA